MNGIPYCGAPPLPGGAAWTFDPLVLLALCAAAFGLARAARGLARAQGAAVALGWVVLAAALVSPLCSLAVALFGARVAQHLLIVLVAAPLLAPAFMRLRAVRAGGTVTAGAVFAAVLWFWHLPAPYAATFHPDGIAWWWMHLTLLAGALWMWASAFAALPARPEAAAMGGMLTGLQMSVLGGVLTFLPRPLYAPHAPDVTLPWGLTPLQDQQLGGLLMWVPGGLLFGAVLLGALVLALREPARAD